MEALKEAEEYLKNLILSLDFAIEEIILHNNFEKEVQLFSVSPLSFS